MSEFREGDNEAEQRGYKHPGISVEYDPNMPDQEKRAKALNNASLLREIGAL